MHQKFIYSFCHSVNIYQGILKKVYRLSPVGSSPKEYLIRFRSNDKTSYHIHIMIGQFIKFVNSEELELLMKSALSGKSRDGFGEALLKYFEDKYISRVIPVRNDRSLIFCFTNQSSWRIDLFGTGQSRISSCDKNIYWNPVAKEVESIEQIRTLEEILSFRNEKLELPKQITKPITKETKKRHKLSPEEYIKLGAEKHLKQADLLFSNAENKIINAIENETNIDWKETNLIFSEYKEKKEKGERASEYKHVKIKKGKTNLLNLKFIKPTTTDYHFAYTSNGLLVLGSKKSTDVDNMIRSYGQPNNLYFHIDEHGGSSVFLINSINASPKDIEETASLTVAWSCPDSKSEVSVFYVNSNQISNNAPSGMFLHTGSVFITGKKNILSKRIPLPVYYLRVVEKDTVQLVYGCHDTQDSTYYKLNCTLHPKPQKKLNQDLKKLLTSESFVQILVR